MKDCLRKFIKFFSIEEFFWLLNSFILSLISFYSNDVENSYRLVPIYLLYLLVFVLLVFIENYFLKKGEIREFPIKKRVFVLGCLFIFFSEPLFENDHFRYIWEGRTLWHGINPYLRPPESILNIFFLKKESIAFPGLSTIYPPLSLFFFALVGWLPFKPALLLLMILNAFFVWKLLFWCWEVNNNRLFLLLSIPFLQKEFIQSVHIDLLAVVFVLSLLIKNKKKENNVNTFLQLHLFGVMLAFYTKIISILLLPSLLMRTYIMKGTKKFIIQLLYSWLFSLPLILLYGYLFYNKNSSGVSRFSNDWLWCPGFYSFLVRFFKISDVEARYVALLCFVCVLLFVHIMAYLKIKKLDSRVMSSLAVVTFSSLFFFSPVVNSWYFIWILPFAFYSNSQIAIYYVLLSQLAYLPHYNIVYSTWAEIGVHMLYPLILCQFFFNLIVNRKNESLI